MAIIDAISELLDPIVAELGVSVYDLEFNGGVLRVAIEKPEGVDLDALTEVNRRLSRAIDLHDPIPSKFNLEVTSPGLERKLRTEAHWASAVGDDVRVKLRSGAESERRFTATVVSTTGNSVKLKTSDGETEVPFDDISSAKTIFDWRADIKKADAKDVDQSTKSGPEQGKQRSEAS